MIAEASAAMHFVCDRGSGNTEMAVPTLSKLINWTRIHLKRKRAARSLLLPRSCKEPRTFLVTMIYSHATPPGCSALPILRNPPRPSHHRLFGAAVLLSDVPFLTRRSQDGSHQACRPWHERSSFLRLCLKRQLCHVPHRGMGRLWQADGETSQAELACLNQGLVRRSSPGAVPQLLNQGYGV